MNIISQLGPAIHACRMNLGITRDEVAALADVSPALISQLENGQRHDFSLALAERICVAVGLELIVATRGQITPPVFPKSTRQRVRRPS